jgi:hypothetical protein
MIKNENGQKIMANESSLLPHDLSTLQISLPRRIVEASSINDFYLSCSLKESTSASVNLITAKSGWPILVDAAYLYYAYNHCGLRDKNQNPFHNKKLLQGLIDHNFNLNINICAPGTNKARDKNIQITPIIGGTVLHVVAHYADIRAFRILISLGADFTIRDKNGLTALEHAPVELKSSFQEVIDEHWIATLHQAVEIGDYVVLQKTLQTVADNKELRNLFSLDITAYYSEESALMLAARHGSSAHCMCIHQLLAYATMCDFQKQYIHYALPKTGVTALDIAVQNNPTIYDVLARYDENIHLIENKTAKPEPASTSISSWFTSWSFWSAEPIKNEEDFSLIASIKKRS